MLGAVADKQMRNIGHEGVLGVRVSEQRVDSHKQLKYVDRRVPSVPQNADGQTTSIVDLQRRSALIKQIRAK